MSLGVTLTGSPYTIGNPKQIHIEQGVLGQGIQFHVGKQRIPYSLETVFPHKMMGARMNMVTDITSINSARILVPEHILSLLINLSLELGGGFRPDLSIHLPESNKRCWGKDTFVPIFGPGSWCDSLDSLRVLIKNALGCRVKVGKFDALHAAENRNIGLYSDKVAEGNLGESNSCLANIVSHTQYDIQRSLQITSQPAEVNYNHLNPLHYTARAMGRLPDWYVYYPLKIAHTLGLFNGITPKNYFIAGPRDKGEVIRSKMAMEYQAGYNEHMYHTLYADLPGELAALAASLEVDWFNVSLTMKNMTHFDRLERFKQLKRNKVLLIQDSTELH